MKIMERQSNILQLLQENNIDVADLSADSLMVITIAVENDADMDGAWDGDLDIVSQLHL